MFEAGRCGIMMEYPPEIREEDQENAIYANWVRALESFEAMRLQKDDSDDIKLDPGLTKGEFIAEVSDDYILVALPGHPFVVMPKLCFVPISSE